MTPRGCKDCSGFVGVGTCGECGEEYLPKPRGRKAGRSDPKRSNRVELHFSDREIELLRHRAGNRSFAAWCREILMCAMQADTVTFSPPWSDV